MIASFTLFGTEKEVPPPQSDLIVKREFAGVYAEKTYKRYYPQPQPNAQIIGLTNSEELGIEGKCSSILA